MDKSRGHSHKTLNNNNHTTIIFYTNKFTFYTFKNATGNANTLSSLQINSSGV